MYILVPSVLKKTFVIAGDSFDISNEALLYDADKISHGVDRSYSKILSTNLAPTYILVPSGLKTTVCPFDDASEDRLIESPE